MSATFKRGFTIIETMLFLAVTGVLVITILAGTGTSINIQRYRDSVSTFKSTLEQQYSDVSTVRNEIRTEDISCNTNADILTSGATLPRGQSDCVVLGRYVAVSDTKITASSVVGNKPDSSAVYAADIDELKSYNLSLLTSTTETSELEWGARIAWPIGGASARPDNPTPRDIGILILRSPTSGLIYTFTGNDLAVPLGTLIQSGGGIPGQSVRTICIDSDGGFSGGLAIQIGAYASGPSFIQMRSNDNMGGSVVCG